LAFGVEDVDETIAEAACHGANVEISPGDQFYGYRAGRIRDPFGHVWIISKRIEDLSTEEMQRRLDALTGES